MTKEGINHCTLVVYEKLQLIPQLQSWKLHQLISQTHEKELQSRTEMIRLKFSKSKFDVQNIFWPEQHDRFITQSIY